MKTTLICIDRDGTLIYDDKYHLGRQENWKSLITILPGVVEGIKALQKIQNAPLYMITNQPGIAVEDFPLLTFARAHEVCKEVLKRLQKEGAELDGYFLCPHAHPDYTKKRPYSFNQELVCACECIKPRLGMVFDALRAKGLSKENTEVYVIGDRASDVKTALSIGGTGILIPFKNETGEAEKVKTLKDKNHVSIAKDFLGAAEYIVHNISAKHSTKPAVA